MGASFTAVARIRLRLCCLTPDFTGGRRPSRGRKCLAAVLHYTPRTEYPALGLTRSRLDLPRTHDFICGEVSLQQPALSRGRTPRFDVWRFEMPIQARLIWPQFREPNKAWIKWVFRNVVGDTGIVLVRGLDEQSQMRKNFGNPLWREPEYSEHSYRWTHGLSFACTCSFCGLTWSSGALRGFIAQRPLERRVMPQFSPLPASKFRPACRRDNGHKKQLAPTVLTLALSTPLHLPSAPLCVPLEQTG